MFNTKNNIKNETQKHFLYHFLRMNVFDERIKLNKINNISISSDRYSIPITTATSIVSRVF